MAKSIASSFARLRQGIGSSQRLRGKWSWVHLFLTLGMFAVVVVGIYTSLSMNLVGRSLCSDEAMLASSFSKRGFLGIVFGGEFENLQSAPFGWLMFEKVLAKIFGNTEFVLRMGSVLCLVGTVVALWALQKYYFGSEFPLSAAMLLVSLPLVLQYSNMFKQYMGEGLVSVLACGVYALYLSKRIGPIQTAGLWCALLCFSQPVCFVEGGLVLSNLLFSLVERDRDEAKRSLAMGAAICVGFALYYLLWASRMTDVARMREWWENHNGYPVLFASSSEEAKSSVSRLLSIPKSLDTCWPLAIACLVGFTPVFVIRKDRLRVGMVLGILVALATSFLHLFPISTRLWLFAVPLMILVCVTGLEDVFGVGKHGLFAVGVLCVAMAVCNTGIPKYLDPANVYMTGEEYLPEYQYLQSNLGEGDMVYVGYPCKAGFEYTNGYGSTSMAGYRNNVMLGDDFYVPPNKKKEIDRVLAQQRCYVVTSHCGGAKRSSTNPLYWLVHAMQQEGFLELVSFEHESALWYHCADALDCKSHATLESVKEDGGTTIRIHNDGEAFIGNPYDKVLLERDDGVLFEVPKLIPPGEELDVDVDADESRDSVFTLRYQRATGMPTQKVTVPKSS